MMSCHSNFSLQVFIPSAPRLEIFRLHFPESSEGCKTKVRFYQTEWPEKEVESVWGRYWLACFCCWQQGSLPWFLGGRMQHFLWLVEHRKVTCSWTLHLCWWLSVRILTVAMKVTAAPGPLLPSCLAGIHGAHKRSLLSLPLASSLSTFLWPLHLHAKPLSA